jgi:hypothetical protein
MTAQLLWHWWPLQLHDLWEVECHPVGNSSAANNRQCQEVSARVPDPYSLRS